MTSAGVPDADGLPSNRTSFIGREREVDRVRSLLADSRLLTLTGPGGIGKSRLAIEAARRSSRRFVGGVLVVELAAVRDPDQVLSTIGAALGVGELDGASIVEALRQRFGGSETLLLLDNFEHLLDASDAVSDLLEASSTLRITVTSRIPLHLAGEQQYSVGPLELPAAGAPPRRLREVESVALFLERARAVLADWDPNHAELQAVAEVCRRLDGLPLAIELAAARTKILSPMALLDRLQMRLPALAIGPADAPDRQRTMAATIAWSHDLLDPSERQTFARLGVFVGGFTLDGASDLLAEVDADAKRVDALHDLGRLVDHSLLQVNTDTAGRPRFRMLEPIREYALNRLSPQEAESLRDRHLAHFVGFAEAEQANERGTDQAGWIGRVVADRDNIRAALSHALASADGERILRLAAALERRFWLASGDLDLSENRRWLETGLAMDVSAPPELKGKALQRLACTHAVAADRMLGALEEALAEYERAGDEDGLTETLATLGLVAIYRRDLDTADAWLKRGMELARTTDAGPQRLVELLVPMGMLAYRRRTPDLGRNHFEEALAVARSAGDAWGIAQTLVHLGRLALTEGNSRRGQAIFAENVEVARRIGDSEQLAVALCSLASADIASSELVAARSHIDEAARAARELNWWYQVRALDVIAEWLSAAGALEEAVPCLAACEETRQDTEMDWDPDRVAKRADLIERGRRFLRRSAFEEAWAGGRRANLATVLEHALSATREIDVSIPAAADDGAAYSLSPREREVLVLVSDGRSDGDIADELFISKKTASVHVAHIKDKLGVDSRVEIAVAGIRFGLVAPPSREAS